MPETLKAIQGEFSLSRFPKRTSESLRAWDAADEYILEYISEQNLLKKPCRLLIVNDSFGALSVALSKYNPLMQSDSYLAHQAVKLNLSDNKLPEDSVTPATSLESLASSFDVVLLKVPKSLALLEDQLRRLRPCLTHGTVLLAAGMVKGVHSSTLKLFEKFIGATHTSLARKKARLIFSSLDASLAVGANPYPKSYLLESTEYKIINHSGVFSQESLDIGTRFFLANLPSVTGEKTIIDLGCGNGVVGLVAATRSPDSELIFIDESYMAIDSAKQNFMAAFGESRKACFQIMNCLAGMKEDSVDIVLNNPPFHLHNAVGDSISRQMFQDSKTVLKTGGQLWVIGNRHLGYHVVLKKLFGNCKVVASNKKFVVLMAVK